MGYLLTIDIGTEGARAGIFDSSGRRLADAGAPYPTKFPRAGWAEQNPDDWWRAAVQATRQALAASGVAEVAAIGVATTASTVVVLDDRGLPLRPAILWMDSRAAAQSERTAAQHHQVLRYSGGSDSAEWLIPKAMWLAEQEPEIYRRAATIAESVDYLTYRLTGCWVGSRLNATCKWNYDHRVGLPTDLYQALGVADLAEKLPEVIRPVGAIAAQLCPSAAVELGLVPGVPVVTGGIDAHLTLLPLRGLAANPVTVVAGTSNAFVAELAEPVFAPTIWGPYPAALTPGQWLIEGGQISAGAALSWLSERVLNVDRQRLGELIHQASQVSSSEHGLLVLDHFMGNRTPLRDPHLRGAIFGISLATTPAQLYRATVEAVAFGTRQVLDSFQDLGVDTGQAYFSGGIRHNPLWLQVTADVLGRPIRYLDTENLTTRALAILCQTAISAESASDVAARFAPRFRTVEPDLKTSHILAAGYQRYLAATALLRDFRSCHQHASATGVETKVSS